MKNFSYFRPATVEAAVALLENRWGNTELLAGGSDLHELQKDYIAQPTRVVSLSGIGGLGTIQTDVANPPQWMRLGAGAKIADIAAHAAIPQRFAALSQ